MLIQHDDDELYQGYLAKVYHGTSAKANYTAAHFSTEQVKRICLTYGEMHYFGVKKVCRAMQLTSQDKFLDLGSGLGKFALQVFMQAPVDNVLGIEAATSLYEQSQQVKLNVQQELGFLWEDRRQLTYLCDNFLTADWQAATAVYTCSTCFTQDLLIAIGDRLNQEKQVRVVASLRPLPTLQRLRLKTIFAVECTWDTTLCYVYV